MVGLGQVAVEVEEVEQGIGVVVVELGMGVVVVEQGIGVVGVELGIGVVETGQDLVVEVCALIKGDQMAEGIDILGYKMCIPVRGYSYKDVKYNRI